MLHLEIEKVVGREIIDSRGNPTVEAEVYLAGGTVGRGAAPSGASTGEFEALELRDGNKDRFGGKGVSKAVENINITINEALKGIDASDIYAVDGAMLAADGTKDKSNLGANAILAVSIAAVRAAATALQIPLYRLLGGVNGNRLPVPMMNILNGGAHASNNVDIQEFMILPVGAKSFKEGLRWCSEVYHCLKGLLKERNLSVAVGDEGGFAPDLESEEQVLDIIVEAVEKSGFQKGKDFKISLDVAASEWKGSSVGKYTMPKKNKNVTSDELIEMWENIVNKYSIFSIEDPLDEEDWDGWKKLTQRIGSKVRLVGDDLFVTNVNRLQKGIKEKSANAILIKPNQIGSITETIKAVQLAQKKGMIAIMSHRSGESEDTTIADLAVALNTGYIKTGAPCRGERTAKYNQLLRIEEML